MVVWLFVYCNRRADAGQDAGRAVRPQRRGRSQLQDGRLHGRLAHVPVRGKHAPSALRSIVPALDARIYVYMTAALYTAYS